MTARTDTGPGKRPARTVATAAILALVLLAPTVAAAQQTEPRTPPVDETMTESDGRATTDPETSGELPTPGEGDDGPATMTPEEELRLIEQALGRSDDSASTEAVEGSAERDNASSGVTANVPPSGRTGTAFNPEISLILDIAAGWYRDENINLGGHDPARTGFTLQQLEMHLAASVDPFFRMDANIVFSEFGVEVEEAYATTLALPAGLQLRAGLFLSPIGRLNTRHPHSWAFAEQSLVNGKFFGSEGSRGLGAELSWLIPLPWYAELVGVVQQPATSCCMRSFAPGSDFNVRGPGDFVYTLRLEQYFDLGEHVGLQWGLGGQFGPHTSGAENRTEIYATDIYLRYRPASRMLLRTLALTGELLHRRRQEPGRVLADTGGYVSAVYRHSRSWAFGVRYERVSGIDDDPLDPEWENFRERTTAQTTFYPSHFSRLRAQLGAERADVLDRTGIFAVLAAEFVIGAHGAHDY